MLVCHTQNEKVKHFNFIHIPKTGGTSVRNALVFLYDSLGIVYGQTDNTPVLHHVMPDDYFYFSENEKYKNNFSFLFVRNPFDRLLSGYSDFTQQRIIGRVQDNFKTHLVSHGKWDDETLVIYRKYETNVKKFETFKSFHDHYMRLYDWNVDGKSKEYFNELAAQDEGEFLTIKKNTTFKDFVMNLEESGWIKDVHFKPQSNFLHDGKLPDFVGKFENLQQDFKKLSENHVPLEETLRHERKTHHKQYEDVYDQDMVRVVKKLFEEDFERFDYQ